MIDMDELKNLKELMEQKTKQKVELLKKLKTLNLGIREKQLEISKKIPKSKEGSVINPDVISKKIEKLEFYISTSAYTPTQEKMIIKKIDELKKQLKSSLENQKEWDEIKKIKEEIKQVSKKKKEIKAELTKIIAELDELYKKIIIFSTKKKKFKGRSKEKIEKKGESSRSFAQEDPKENYLTLEDILKINQKQQKS